MKLKILKKNYLAKHNTNKLTANDVGDAFIAIMIWSEFGMLTPLYESIYGENHSYNKFLRPHKQKKTVPKYTSN